MADPKLAQQLRKQSVDKYNQSDKQMQEIHELTLEIRSMEAEIKAMRYTIDSLTHSSHVLRLEGDRLKNQAFTMSLGAFNE